MASRQVREQVAVLNRNADHMDARNARRAQYLNSKGEYTLDGMRKLLAANQAFATRGLLRIFDYQTAVEQDAEQTHERNGVGFTGADAEILSSMAKWVRTWEALPDTHPRKAKPALSDKQLAIVFKKMPKYAKQLLVIAYGRVPSKK